MIEKTKDEQVSEYVVTQGSSLYSRKWDAVAGSEHAWDELQTYALKFDYIRLLMSQWTHKDKVRPYNITNIRLTLQKLYTRRYYWR